MLAIILICVEYFFLYYYLLKSCQRKCQSLYMKFVQVKTKVKSTTHRCIHLLLGARGRMELVTMARQRVEKADGM
jgi:hypothetical protein